ncbi:exopolyphosphatase PRUNE1 [Phycodurus eques]|uniref:exopolyphosphatase PRUNE1 n=1 Tax=Phycodurus eques TaxID=693459 RepID=UPI002ACE215F|nr:exopolyphosphatase PRUNE1 [Phycodurus eques]
MDDFLSTCHAAAKASARLPSGPAFHVVLGNEACDLDSMVSALVYAYYLSKTRDDRAALSVPLLNIRQGELLLRSDNMFLLRRTGLCPDTLLFRDQLDLAALRRTGRLRLTLVDHNVLPGSDADLEGAVVEVIDHRELEREPGPSCPVTVEMVGSCATLVTERLIQNAPHILDQQVALLLYATILTDCVNMAPAACKVTPKDSQYAAALEARFPSLPPRGALFQAVHKAKFDVSGLNTEQMLMKDMKTLAGSFSIAVSVLYLPIEAFMQRAELEAELSVFCRKLSFDLLVLMSICFTETKQPIRELALFSHSDSRREQASRFLERAGNPALDLCPISSPHRHVAAYHQGNALASRKKLLPLLKDFLRTSDDEDDEDEGRVPPTPMNSLVEGCPLDAGPPPISADALHDKFSKMDAY